MDELGEMDDEDEESSAPLELELELLEPSELDVTSTIALLEDANGLLELLALPGLLASAPELLDDEAIAPVVSTEDVAEGSDDGGGTADELLKDDNDDGDDKDEDEEATNELLELLSVDETDAEDDDDNDDVGGAVHSVADSVGLVNAAMPTALMLVAVAVNWLGKSSVGMKYGSVYPAGPNSRVPLIVPETWTHTAYVVAGERRAERPVGKVNTEVERTAGATFAVSGNGTC